MTRDLRIASEFSALRKERVVVLINNFNYGHFLSQCFNSVFSQQCKPDIVVFVDDGSTDNSMEIVNNYSANHSELTVITKKNGGQLSAFNAAAGLIDREDYVFFLDSDDIWPLDYIYNVMRLRPKSADMVFVKAEPFRDCIDETLKSSVISAQEAVLIQSSSATTRQFNCWIGSPTSAVSITGQLFKMIFPYADESCWRTRADDIIIYSSSILFGSKLYLPSLAISYRVHGDNNFYGILSAQKNPHRAAAIDRLFREMCMRACVSPHSSLTESLREVRGLKDELFKQFCFPSRTVMRFWVFYRFARFVRRILRKIFATTYDK